MPGGYNGYYESKIAYLYVEISRFLNKHQCTYDEFEDVMDVLVDEYRTRRKLIEYDTRDDYLNNRKRYDCGQDVIEPLHHITESAL